MQRCLEVECYPEALHRAPFKRSFKREGIHVAARSLRLKPKWATAPKRRPVSSIARRGAIGGAPVELPGIMPGCCLPMMVATFAMNLSMAWLPWRRQCVSFK